MTASDRIDITQSTPEALSLLTEKLVTVRKRLMTPLPHLSLSDWAEKNIRFSLSSPEPGPFDWRRCPYQREMLDVAGDSVHERVVFQTAAQIGKSSIMLALLGLGMTSAAPQMLVCSDKSQANTFSLTKLAPAIEESPVLRQLVGSKRVRDSGNKILEKVTAGNGFVVLVSAKSVHSLRSRAIRVLLLDEVDSYLQLGEGNPCDLAIARTSNFGANRKIIFASTPSISGFSRIEREFQNSDQRHFTIPCPLCGEFQELKWAGIKWSNDDPSTVHYECEHCHQSFGERYKLQAMLKGKWVAANPQSAIAGFHLSAIYSPFVKWHELVREWLDAQRDPQRLQSFVNLRLAEAFEDRTNAIDLGSLASHCHSYGENIQVPSDTLLFAGVDINQDFIEVGLWAFSPKEEAYLVQEIQLMGDPSQPQIWEELKDVLRSTYVSPSGPVRIVQAAMDSGYMTPLVYKYTTVFRAEGIPVVPIKGYDGARSVFEWSRFRTEGTPRVGIVGVSQVKSILLSRLKNINEAGPGYLHFHEGVHPNVVEQIAAGERKITLFKKGVPHQVWKQLKDRVEALDALVYAYSAMFSLSRKNLETLFGNARAQKVVADTQQPQNNAPKSSNPAPTPTPKRVYDIPRRQSLTGGFRY